MNAARVRCTAESKQLRMQYRGPVTLYSGWQRPAPFAAVAGAGSAGQRGAAERSVAKLTDGGAVVAHKGNHLAALLDLVIVLLKVAKDLAGARIQWHGPRLRLRGWEWAGVRAQRG